MATTISNTNNQDKKKAKRIAFWFHTILLIGFTIPFLTQTITKSPTNYEKVITIEFDDFKSAAAKSSTKAATPATTQPVATPKPVEAPKKVETPKPIPTKTAPRKPVLKTPEKAPTIKEAPVVKETPPVVKPTPKPIEPTPTPEPVVEAEAAPEASTETSTEASGTASDKGEGDIGTSDSGNAETDGKADEGDNGMDFSGDGLFSRRVIHRAEIKQLTKEEGTIVINLCVNRTGRVVYTDFNKEESTIDTPDLIREAMQATIKYRFEKDYTASAKQCGKMTYIFEIEEE